MPFLNQTLPDPGLQPEDTRKVVRIKYTNHRNEFKTYNVIPDSIFFGSTAHHLRPQWILVAFDVERSVSRSFAMDAISYWQAVEGL